MSCIACTLLDTNASNGSPTSSPAIRSKVSPIVVFSRAARISARATSSIDRRVAAAACSRSGSGTGVTERADWPAGPTKTASISRWSWEDGSRLP